jgi:hypothetical protein
MTRRYQPDGTLLLTAMAGRVDALEKSAEEGRKDVAAIGRGLADITAQLRRLNDTSHPTGPAPSSSSGDELAEQQPDWLTVDDPSVAREWLAAAQGFVDGVLVHHGVGMTMPCWPLHPTVVADLLAMACERDAAYTGATPTPVSEWLSRWLPAGIERITRAMAECVVERGHRVHGRTYDVTGFDPASAATWWATERHLDAVQAFALPVI